MPTAKQKNGPHAPGCTHSDASDGRFYFNLKEANHQVIGTSQMHKTTAAHKAGMESVRTNGPTTTIKYAACG